ncbi:hypothetical protein M3689_02735 [Alkalihalophilus marmarensis]|jgi:hypothetical protein|uniref:Uncharacterized protein n=1 Tax=Alkalihalophilus marmarensis DSM 21297 TaxID=1188261 RepID=U6SS31_9BACI|nr:hypothetical protein [Alkalihalophilus marmarensis]ERN54408.1 hypothetical protein A33I_08285 [Alkalihalophilus marmarensis DSM 21297]MCM3488220.1 hypothetical protein [Alkalihalophilus marmarensis]
MNDHDLIREILSGDEEAVNELHNRYVDRLFHFTEWRFSEEGVSENSFYAFGKLEADFPFQRSMQTMFGAFDIDLSYYEDLGGGTPYHYGYYSGMEEAFIDGYITLLETPDGWYYKHSHADRQDYNGIHYSQKLQMFLEFMEWHD